MPATKQSNIGLWQGWSPGEDGWGDEMNYNLRSLDGLVQASVIDVINDPPASPGAGDMYQIDGSPTGAFSGHNSDLARWSGSAWEFYVPKDGWKVLRLSNGRYRVYRDGGWHRWDSVTPDADTIVKRNGTGQSEFADPSANSHAVTLNYAESNYEKKRQNNLNATTDPGANDDSSAGYEVLSKWVNTSSGEIFVCLSATAGAAEWGKTTLTLDELGSAALVDVGTASGQVPTNGDLNISNWDTAYGWGDHSQAGYALASNLGTVAFSGSYADLTGTGDVYERSNILGTVSQVGGVPTGAIIEHDSNSDGEYVKFANGTLMQLTTEFDIDYSTAVTSQDVPLPVANTNKQYGISLNRTESGAPAGEVSLSAKIGLFSTSTDTVRLGFDDPVAGGGTYLHVVTTVGRWY